MNWWILLFCIIATSAYGTDSFLDPTSLVFDDNKLVISSGGMGIQGAPSYPLHVQGSAYLTGPITFDLGVSSDVYTVDWGLGNIQILRITQNGGFSLSFVNPPPQPTRLFLIIQYASSAPGPLTFVQPSGAAIRFGYQVTDQEFFPTPTSTDVFSFYWDSTAAVYYGRISSGAK